MNMSMGIRIFFKGRVWDGYYSILLKAYLLASLIIRNKI